MRIPQKHIVAFGTFLLNVFPTLAPTDRTLEPLTAQLPIQLGSPASASIVTGYVPPPGRHRVQRTEGVGSRGCTQSTSITLHLLVPSDHIAQTVSTHPTFLWYVSKTSTPMRFTLVEPRVSKPIVDRYVQVKKAGIVKLEMPSDAPALEVGKEYRWTVSAICNPYRPSENVYARAWIVRVQKPIELEQKLATLSTERAQIYAQSGIWYDAIATLYDTYSANPREPSTSEYFFALLNQIGLSHLTTELAAETQQRLAHE